MSCKRPFRGHLIITPTLDLLGSQMSRLKRVKKVTRQMIVCVCVCVCVCVLPRFFLKENLLISSSKLLNLWWVKNAGWVNFTKQWNKGVKLPSVILPNSVYLCLEVAYIGFKFLKTEKCERLFQFFVFCFVFNFF